MIVRIVSAALVAAAVAAPVSLASSLPIRTERVSAAADGATADGASADPVLSTTGRILAFDTKATNLTPFDTNGPVSDIVNLDLATNARRLVSAGGNGPSYTPTISANGQRVVFTSDASNLVPGDTNGFTDIFLRDGGQPIIRLTTVGATQADGPSFQPELSADGQTLVFSSSASNLVPGDTNGQPDVFVQNLRNGVITRISVSSSKQQANGRSTQPAISADGRFVSYASGATNLVKHDTNGVADVFVTDLVTHRTERVSLSSSGKQQNRAVTSPFTQISDISGDGRFITFDSDATNLYPADTNRHTDIFLHDRQLGTTTLISASSFNVEGNNDSFAPRMTPNGHFVTFQSFATNLAPGGGPREDIFLRDTRENTTSLVNVTADGSPRGPELVPQLLQRPAISSNGKIAAFSSTVANLTPGDTNGAEDVFVRLMEPPVGRIVNGPRTAAGRVKLTVTADDPLARTFVCQIDLKTPFKCGPDINVKHNSGRDLKIRAGGLGTLFSAPLTVPISNDRRAPTVTIHQPAGSKVRVLTGRAKDSSGIQSVLVSVVTYVKGTTCRYLATPTKYKKLPCFQFARATFLRASGKRSWAFKLPHSIKGPLVVQARAIDNVGNISKAKVLSTTVG
jgi:Tol biopolymer transport system component